MPTQTLMFILVAGTFGVAAIAMLGATFFTVEQRSAAIVQRLGKFLGEAWEEKKIKQILEKDN